MTDPTERALALASEALHAIRADLVRCEGESGSCHATLERAEGGDWIAVTEAVPAVARVIQGVIDEADALKVMVARLQVRADAFLRMEDERDALKREVEHLRFRDQRIRELAAATHSGDALARTTAFYALRNAIEETP